MSGTIVLLFALAAAFVVATKLGLLKKGRGGRSEHWPLFPKKVLTPVEQQLYQRLLRAFPDHVTAGAGVLLAARRCEEGCTTSRPSGTATTGSPPTSFSAAGTSASRR